MPSFPYYYLYYLMHEDENEDENQTKRKSKPHRNKKRTNTKPKKPKPPQKNRKERLKKSKKTPKMKAIFDGLIKPIIQLMIIFVPPFILHLYTLMSLFQAGLIEAIFSLFPLGAIFAPYFYIYLIIWVAIYAYIWTSIHKRRQSKIKTRADKKC